LEHFGIYAKDKLNLKKKINFPPSFFGTKTQSLEEIGTEKAQKMKINQSDG
jgi:hypothetical protein